MNRVTEDDYAKGAYAHPVPVEIPDYIKLICIDSSIDTTLDMITYSDIIVVTDNNAANEFFDKFGRRFATGDIDQKITDDESFYFIPTFDKDKSGGVYKWNRIIEGRRWYYILNDITESFAVLKKAHMLDMITSEAFLADHYPQFS